MIECNAKNIYLHLHQKFRMGRCCWFKGALITAGVFIGTFEGDDIRTHNKRFLNMAIILLQRIAEFPYLRSW